MTIFQMLDQSWVLTLLGMGIVFSFLVILVVCVSIMGKIFRALGYNRDPGLVVAEAPAAHLGGSAGTGAVIAAITTAVNEYRKDNS